MYHIHSRNAILFFGEFLMADYQSTRGGQTASASAAILSGLAPDGGLYVQSAFPRFPMDRLTALSPMELSAEVLSLLLGDFSLGELQKIVNAAYADKFDTPELTPTAPVGEDYILELFHGPTSAFKDVALCVLPYLMTAAKKKNGITDDILILTATSGDTGKAAMSGFMDVPGVKIIVFYPDGGVSAVQEKQMLTQEGRNVAVCAVSGNFDDAQTAVKRAFFEVNEKGLLAGDGVRLSSANSINIGRLAPQVAYYFKAYRDLLLFDRIKMGEKVDFVVPTGNFGDILAGYMAKRMGLPVGTLVCASNENSVLTDFIRTGVYDRRREFHKTLSPSMDILISSNLERLLYFLADCDADTVRELMRELSENGCYTLNETMLQKLQSEFFAACCDDADTVKTIGDVFKSSGYLMDTHTAVAYNAMVKYKVKRQGNAPIVVLSTASPYKFPEAVLRAIGGARQADGFAAMEELERVSGASVPKNLSGLRNKPVLHSGVIDRDAIPEYVLNKARIKEWRQ